ncbi:MAG: ABC transporter permease [Rhodobacter sp.]|jgi:spermidine/putrescine transport system permease protein|nr:ABC transporter permease [Rhodobacter sp.]MCA3457783.1 ABC transporter permease [Rhodobacter sp.]MCA3461206.1 ABC transporter permease [Rhodobacter sp.]MCA3463198.1 ABC transporter permease [Rhodobacter sp.]MCA3468871.1 ABC transporter permease [Rhodobacter sp.]
MKDLLNRYGLLLTTVFAVLTGFWILVLVVLPNIYLFEHSFKPYLPVAELGGPKDVYSLDNYLTFFRSPIHISVFVWTVVYSALVTVICFLIAYPLAYYLSKVSARALLPTIFLLLFIPLWVSEVLRSFAWFIILALKGPLNASLLGLGIIEDPVRWISGFRGVIIGLVYTYVLFMLFPLYNAIQSLDTNQIEAAEDLGAPWWRTHWRVILPHAKPGIASGSVMVFMLSAGSILVPTLLASTNSRWFTEIIQQWMFESQDWNTGSAYAFLLLILCTVFVSVVMRVFRVKLSDIAK